MFGIFWEINSTSQSFCISAWLNLKLLLTMRKITLSSSCKYPIFNKWSICLMVCAAKQGISFNFFWSNFPSKHVIKWFYYIIRFLIYKQHFHNQPQAEENKQKNKCLCSWCYTINHNGNEDENKSHNNRYDINRHILDEDTNTNIVNIKCLSC